MNKESKREYPYPLYDVDRYRTLTGFVRGIRERFADRVALTVYDKAGEAAEYTYRRFTDDIYSLGEALTGLLPAGGHVAVISESGYLCVTAILAATVSGNVAVPIDLEQCAETMADMVTCADADLLLVSDSVAPIIESSPVLSAIPFYILNDDASSEKSVAYLMSRTTVTDEIREREAGERDDALIVYTSGTTSTSKPVLLSQLAIACNASEAVVMVHVADRVMNSLPLYHLYGLTCGVFGMLVQGSNICLNGNIKYMLRDTVKFNPGTVFSVPLIAEMLCKQLVSRAGEVYDAGESAFERFILRVLGKKTRVDRLTEVKNAFIPGLYMIICGGAYLSPKISRAMESFGVSILVGYGITECGPLISVNRNDAICEGSVGLPLPSYEVKVLNGEICARGDSVMTGYYKNPQLTAEAFNGDWYRTGDLGCINNRGYIFITGRMKNIIVLKNGKKISPEELESYLVDIPIIKEVVAYGSSAGNESDDVIPAITVYPSPTETAGMMPYEILEAVQSEVDRVNTRLPSYKQIRLINLRENEFDKTAAKKIKR